MRKRNIALLIAALFALLILPSPADAEGSLSCALLVPTDGLGFVRLIGYQLEARIIDQDAEPQIEMVQRYSLHNRDRVKGKPLTVRLDSVPETSVSLLLDGSELSPSEAAPQQWPVTLAANQTLTLVLHQTLPLSKAPLVTWHWDPAPLADWGDIESVRVTFCLPWAANEGMLLRISPPPSESDGQCLAWSHESPAVPEPVDLILYNPTAWRQEQTLSASGEHLALAHLIAEMDAAAAKLDLEGYDRSAETLAQLLTAVEVQPTDVAARQALAEWYIARADGNDDRSLNYLLLAGAQLESVLQTGDPQELLPQLAEIYQRAASIAQGLDQMAAALDYLDRSQRYAALGSQAQGDASEEVILRWGLDLAQRGQVQQAVIQLEDRLSPRMGDLLTRYVPPFQGIQTEVALRPGHRQVRYRIQTFSLSIDALSSHLQEIVARLQSISGVETLLTLPAEGSEAILTVSVTFDTLAALRDTSAELLATLEPDAYLLDAALALPWSSLPSTYGTAQELLRDTEVYSESIDLSALDAQWNEFSQYAGWQLAEISDATPADERAALEQQLAILVLREQLYVWQGMPLVSHWRYSAELAHGARDWHLRWGQERELEATTVTHHGRLLAQLAALLLGLFVLLGLLVRWGIRRRKQRRPRW